MRWTGRWPSSAVRRAAAPRRHPRPAGHRGDREGGRGRNAAHLAHADADKVTPGHEHEVDRQYDDGADQPDGYVALRIPAFLSQRPGRFPSAEGEDREHHAKEQIA